MFCVCTSMGHEQGAAPEVFTASLSLPGEVAPLGQVSSLFPWQTLVRQSCRTFSGALVFHISKVGDTYLLKVGSEPIAHISESENYGLCHSTKLINSVSLWTAVPYPPPYPSLSKTYYGCLCISKALGWLGLHKVHFSHGMSLKCWDILNRRHTCWHGRILDCSCHFVSHPGGGILNAGIILTKKRRIHHNFLLPQ